MISSIVIIASLAFAAVYVIAWLLRPGLRQQIEQPKHWFQDELARYDQQCGQDQKEAETKRQ
jgi:hypothetical protein